MTHRRKWNSRRPRPSMPSSTNSLPCCSSCQSRPPIDHSRAVIVQRSVQKSRQPGSVALFRVDGGAIGAARVSDLGRTAYQVSINGRPHSIRSGSLSAPNRTMRWTHGAHGDSAALMLPRTRAGEISFADAKENCRCAAWSGELDECKMRSAGDRRDDMAPILPT